MNMNLYLREFNRNKKELLIWTVIISTLLIMVMAFYPSISKDIQMYEQMIETLPKPVIAMFNLDDLSMGDLFGYYSLQGFLIFGLMGSIYVMILSSGILSKEEGDKTIEFLLSKPISRREVITSKLLCYLTNIIILNIVISIVIFISFKFVSEESFSMKTFILISLAPLFIQLIFSAIGFLISVFITKSKKITPFSMIVVFVAYFLGVMSDINSNMEFLKYLSPFEYFKPGDIVLNNQIDINSIIVLVSVNIVCIALTYFIYQKKDITI